MISQNQMKQNTYNVTSSIVFGLVAVLHLVRAVFGWTVVIYGYNIGIWVSVVIVIVAGLLSFYAGKLTMK